jgi:GH25 family lysozyme M1 (1,4-beta-N-acetylmuramidase)
MAGVFICYRRSDSSDVTGRLYDRLVQRFGRRNVFKDVFSIELGRDFEEVISAALAKSVAMLVVIGERWDVSRLADENDPVRREIERAIAAGVRIIPLFLDGVKMPDEHALPASLAPFAKRQGLPLRNDPDFDNDVNRLIAGLPAPMSRRVLLAGPVVAGAGFLAFKQFGARGRDEPTNRPPLAAEARSGAGEEKPAPAPPPADGFERAKPAPKARAQGVDITYVSNKERFDWAVAKAQIEFVFMMATHGIYDDATFPEYWAAARRAGLIRGAYHNYLARFAPMRQANFFLSLVKLEHGDLPPVLSLASPGEGDVDARGLRTWLSIVEKATGRRPIIFTTRYMWESLKLPAEFGDYPLWVDREVNAKEAPLPPGWDRWTFQQGQWTAIPGIGDGNLSLFKGGRAELRAFADGV